MRILMTTAVIALVACGGDKGDTGDTGGDTTGTATGSTATGTATGGGTATGTATGTGTGTGGTPVSWNDMDFGQRQAYMADVVLPTMQPLFEAYDPTRFSSMTCATCHGASAADGTFTMPNDALFEIDPYNFPSGAGVDFMMAEVVPTMVDLLDAEPFNSTTGGGFGCFSCHTAP